MVRGSGKRILLIDSELETHAGFRGCLSIDDAADESSDSLRILEGLQVESASHGPEGWTRIRESLRHSRPYLLAVVAADLGGEWDGVETVQRLWREDDTLPILLCTPPGFTADDRHEITRQLGRIDRFLFLPKPLGTDEVRQMVASQVDRRLARGELEEVNGELGRALQRARDAAESANRAKGEFMANISHEIRTPMNAILGFTRLLQKEPLNDDQLQKLGYVCDAGMSLMSLISNVLDYAKLAAGQLEISIAAFNLDAVLADVLETTRPQAAEKDLTIRHHVSEAIPRWLMGDKMRFRQVLVHLIGNAIKFTENGTIHFQMMVDEETDEEVTLRATVTDTGVGIPVERQAVIFECFSQADGSATRQFEGAGLGLTICKQLVDLMGGQIGFRSDPGHGVRGCGACFWLAITLQKHLTDGSEPSSDNHLTVLDEETVPAADGEQIQGGMPHVLLADDDRLNRTLVEMFLGRAGCLIDLAANGSEALAMLRRRRYDLVFMDIQMSEMDGLAATKAIRRQEAVSGDHVPIVVLTATAHSDPQDRDMALQAGADDYLAKPFTPEALLGVVQRFLPTELDEFGLPTGGKLLASVTDGPNPTPSLVEIAQELSETFERERFPDVESMARTIRNLATQNEYHSVADHAMRVQFAARSCDWEQVGQAIVKLQAVLLQEESLVTASETSASP